MRAANAQPCAGTNVRRLDDQTRPMWNRKKRNK